MKEVMKELLKEKIWAAAFLFLMAAVGIDLDSHILSSGHGEKSPDDNLETFVQVWWEVP